MKLTKTLKGAAAAATRLAVALPFVAASPVAAALVGLPLIAVSNAEGGTVITDRTRKPAIVVSSALLCGVASLIAGSAFAAAGPVLSTAAACYIFWPRKKGDGSSGGDGTGDGGMEM